MISNTPEYFYTLTDITASLTTTWTMKGDSSGYADTQLISASSLVNEAGTIIYVISSWGVYGTVTFHTHNVTNGNIVFPILETSSTFL